MGGSRSSASSASTTTRGRSSDPALPQVRSATTSDRRRCRCSSRARSRSASRCCSTARCAVARVIRAADLRALRARRGHRRPRRGSSCSRRAAVSTPSSSRSASATLAQPWLANPDIALWMMFVILTWKYLGFAILLMLAGLQGVPEELVGGRRDRRCELVADPVAHHDPAARPRPSASGRSCRSSARCSCSTWSGSPPRAARSAPPARWRPTWSQYGQGEQPGLRQRRRRHPVPHLARHRAALPAPRHAPRSRGRHDVRGRADMSTAIAPEPAPSRRRTDSTGASRSSTSSRLVDRGIAIGPGALRLDQRVPHQRRSQRRPGGLAEPLDFEQLRATCSERTRSGATLFSSHARRRRHHARRRAPRRHGGLRDRPLRVPWSRRAVHALRRGTACSRSRSRPCRSASCCAHLGLHGTFLGVIIPQVAFALPTTIIILVPFLRAIPTSSRRPRRSTARAASASSGASCCRCRCPASSPSACSRSSAAGTATCCRCS